MNTINTDHDYKTAMERIRYLMSLGSQKISTTEMSELSELSRLASTYEKLRYDFSIDHSQQVI